ncbi:toast rack family protein [Lysinibacillus fusiformis]|uniref:Cell wall-active antibiotics response 4TMS YvqF n=1 Tax=Lysinibacillus fusiformis TaxID=28031 RepID=A0A1H9A5Y7_9BACI|nr:toast rack family protein [Lysinibacillus fusiformis]SCX86527.1 Cell wall-active antibiotics response 4TMS YvqF [Lysinibacillus fusiformis]SEM82438.1 Cell wall-active antibiotics response 4TMS YvqF [Lysinibacillus fusiformis]SEP72079.1 Cell wall-active antibiotics response 4TMS YvqF [Lysinibacillus fusiformis]
MKKLVGLGVVMGTSVFVLSGCFSFMPNKMQEETILVEKDKAKTLEVDIDLGVGEMNLTGGAKEWVEGKADYNIKKLAPQVTYDVSGDTGEVEIKHKGSTKLGISNIKNTWAIQLNDDIPMDLTVETGASLANLDLQGLQLEKLDIEAGVGDLTVNLGGDWKKSFKANIETGVGQTTIIVPSKVGVKLTTEKGIGSSNIEGLISKGQGVYVNEAYDKADVVLDIKSEIGVGDITFKLGK